MEIESLSALTALAHPRRLQVFRMLMRRYPDAVPAGEIAQALDLAPSTLSAALAQLRGAFLVTQARAGTSLRYAADPAGAGRLITYLGADCCRNRPESCLPLVGAGAGAGAVRADRRINVLFVCTGNSARSIIAETLLRDSAGQRFQAFSAGTYPQSTLNPGALHILRDMGHDLSSLRAKHVTEFQTAGAPEMDFVFSVCNRAANEDVPPWPGQPMTCHWGQPDPAKATGTEAERRQAFQQVYDALKARIHGFAALPMDAMDRSSLQFGIDDLAKSKDPA
jgi:protein-tyrosine-phosphatase/DNA-binding transcriptional ArsR family regulator